MERPDLRPNQLTVPNMSTFTPTRFCSVSKTVSTPSSTKLIGLIWMPTNLWSGLGADVPAATAPVTSQLQRAT